MKDLVSHEHNNEAYKLLKQINQYLEQESKFLPRASGLSAIESTLENDDCISPKLRDAKVEDLRSLTRFFGCSTETFVLAVNLLDRFLSLMKVRPKHLPCLGISVFHLAAKTIEGECNIPSAHDLLRISHCKFTVSDLKRMEKIVYEKLNGEFKAVTALHFLHLYHALAHCHTTEGKEFLILDRLEAQLKACSCRFVFSRAKVSLISVVITLLKMQCVDHVLSSLCIFYCVIERNFRLKFLLLLQPSVLALSLLTLEVENLKSVDLFEIILRVQKHSKISHCDLAYWRELVSKCLADYSSPECCKPDNKKLVWIVSRRTARHLQNSYYSVPELPTIPEAGCFSETESEDSCEEMSCGEDSLSSSPRSDNEGEFFPEDLLQQSKWQNFCFQT
ncbi:cyclin-G2 isoform X1 [Heptranchias perlo]|uniref:cyclin-G2 isoform X1 n=1 Tax=Heptranchias perlo TaxID=212740 RepID=UPI003559AE05